LAAITPPSFRSWHFLATYRRTSHTGRADDRAILRGSAAAVSSGVHAAFVKSMTTWSVASSWRRRTRASHRRSRARSRCAPACRLRRDLEVALTDSPPTIGQHLAATRDEHANHGEKLIALRLAVGGWARTRERERSPDKTTRIRPRYAARTRNVHRDRSTICGRDGAGHGGDIETHAGCAHHPHGSAVDDNALAFAERRALGI
jgi:hypothetical protein